MRLDLIWRPEDNIDSAPVRHPSRHTRREMFVGVLDPAVMFILKSVVFAVRIRIAPVPERLNKFFALLFVGELHESFALVVSDDPADILVQPSLVIGTQLGLKRFPVFLLTLLTD